MPKWNKDDLIIYFCFQSLGAFCRWIWSIWLWIHFLVHLNRVVRRSTSVDNFFKFSKSPLNHWTEFSLTWQEARSQRPLQSLCFRSDRKTMMAYQVYVFGLIKKTWWLSLPLIDIFDFSSGTTERNSMKLYRKQVLNFLLHFCVFFLWPLGQSVNKDGTLYSGARFVALWAPCRCPGWEVHRGHLVIWDRPSVCPLVRNSVPPI